MKHRIPMTILSAGLFTAGCIGSALAQTPNDAQQPPHKATASQAQGSDYGNAADKKKVVPSREQVMEDARRPSNSTLDDNAQRQHDPDRAANPATTDINAGRTENGERAYPHGNSMSSGSAGADGSISQRDWDKVDTNHDNLISPQEMSTWLDEHGSAQGSKQ